MKISLFNQNQLNKKYVCYLLLFIGLALHLIYLLQFDDYFDDWNFFLLLILIFLILKHGKGITLGTGEVGVF